MPTNPTQPAIILWERPAAHSIEYCEVHDHDSGYIIAGTVILSLDDLPAQVTYSVDCDLSGRTRSVSVNQLHAGANRQLHITVDEGGLWRQDGDEIPFARGLLDIDLSITPATNTLPIRRLNLDVGNSREVNAVWMLFPTLELKLLEQRYTRTHANRYLYQSLASGFEAQLEVDSLDIVTDYQGIWHRIEGQS